LRALDHLLFERLVELSQCFFCLLALADVDEGEYYAVDTVLGRAVQHYPHQVEVIVRSSHLTLYRRQRPEYLGSVLEYVRVFDVVSDVGQGTADVRADEVEDRP